MSCIRAVAMQAHCATAPQCHTQPARAAMAQSVGRHITVTLSIAPLMRATLPSAGDTQAVAGVACAAGRGPGAERIGADACRPMPPDTDDGRLNMNASQAD
uniref:Uncharacterized protein n=1 Tax=Ralstonia solanacearum CFBP2957 TaxID=859656 RepID=D8P702_RALSL|nr:conserved protein of unknown function [Ralstonia solanacearum CFBP2957]